MTCKHCGGSVFERIRYTSEVVHTGPYTTDWQYHFETYHLDACEKCYVEKAEGRSEINWKGLFNLGTCITGIICAGILFFPILIPTAFLIQGPEANVYAGVIAVSITVFYLVRGLIITPKERATNELQRINQQDKAARYKYQQEQRKEQAKMKKQQEQQLLRSSGILEIDQMTGVEFEQRLERLFFDLGYTVKRTPASGDQGADLILFNGKKRIAVQAKRYSGDTKVGNTAVNEALGGKAFYNCGEAWVITNSSFTEPAKKLAQKAGVRLVDRQALIELLHQQLHSVGRS